MDTNGNRSLVVETTGKVYGPNYEESLSNIRLLSINKVNDTTTVLWKNIEFGSKIEFTYDVIGGGKKTIRIPIIIGTTIDLNDNLPGGVYSYTTYFKPTEDAIDEFICKDIATGEFPQ